MLSDRKSRRWQPSMATPQSVSVRRSAARGGEGKHYTQDRIVALEGPFPRNLRNAFSDFQRDTYIFRNYELLVCTIRFSRRCYHVY